MKLKSVLLGGGVLNIIFENKQKKKGKIPLVDISLLKNHNLKTEWEYV